MSMLIKSVLIREKGPKYRWDKITTSSQVYDNVREMLQNEDREICMTIALDTKNKIIGTNTISIGSLNASIVHPREVFKPLILASAAAFVMVHNHPSGSPEPSQEDRTLTKRIKECAEKLIGIRFLDHVIIGDDTFYSFADRGDM